MFSMWVLVIVVYCDARKNKMTAAVLSTPRQIRSDGLLGTSEIEFLYTMIDATIHPRKKREKVTSRAETSDEFVSSLENIVDTVKHNSERRIKTMPLDMKFVLNISGQ